MLEKKKKKKRKKKEYKIECMPPRQDKMCSNSVCDRKWSSLEESKGTSEQASLA
jgi:hypothetical protein